MEENSGTWYWMNNIENRDESQYSLITPKINGAESVRIESKPHTYAIMKEEANRLSIHINNYRVDKSELYGKAFPEEKWYPYLYEQNAKMENGTLADKEKRETILVIKNAVTPMLGFRMESPEDSFDENNHIRPYSYTINLKEGTSDEWEIRIAHNGAVDFDIITGTVDKSVLGEEVEKAKALSLEGYTEKSVKNLLDAIALAEGILNSEASTQEEVDAQIIALENAVKELVRPDTPDPEKPDTPDPEKPDTPDPEKPDTPDPEKPDTPDQNPQRPSDYTGDNGKTEVNKAVQTGDITDFTNWILLLAAAGISGIALFRIRKNKI